MRYSKNMSLREFEEKLFSKKMIVCVGAGGVGKTTLAATIAVHAAQIGKNVACLTIDPAKRLGDSLGISQSIQGDEDVNQLADITDMLAGVGCLGTLHFGMLNAKETFDKVVREKSSSSAKAEKILKNRLYRYVSGSLSGMQEYMALERLCQLQEDGIYDLIVLDTPPSDNVIDFFKAPSKMKGALDGPLVRMMRKVYDSQSKPGFDLFGRWALSVFSVLARITGGSLLDEIMEFVDALSDLFGNFSKRAAQIEEMLSSDDVEVLMVTRPDVASAKETSDLQKELERSGFHVDGLIFNQCIYPEVTQEVPSFVDEPCRLEIANINAVWNEIFEEEQRVIATVLEQSLGTQTGNLPIPVSIVQMMPIQESRIESLVELWDAISPIAKLSHIS